MRVLAVSCFYMARTGGARGRGRPCPYNFVSSLAGKRWLRFVLPNDSSEACLALFQANLKRVSKISFQNVEGHAAAMPDAFHHAAMQMRDLLVFAQCENGTIRHAARHVQRDEKIFRRKLRAQNETRVARAFLQRNRVAQSRKRVAIGVAVSHREVQRAWRLREYSQRDFDLLTAFQIVQRANRKSTLTARQTLPFRRQLLHFNRGAKRHRVNAAFKSAVGFQAFQKSGVLRTDADRGDVESAFSIRRNACNRIRRPRSSRNRPA